MTSTGVPATPPRAHARVRCVPAAAHHTAGLRLPPTGLPAAASHAAVAAVPAQCPIPVRDPAAGHISVAQALPRGPAIPTTSVSHAHPGQAHHPHADLLTQAPAGHPAVTHHLRLLHPAAVAATAEEVTAEAAVVATAVAAAATAEAVAATVAADADRNPGLFHSTKFNT